MADKRPANGQNDEDLDEIPPPKKTKLTIESLSNPKQQTLEACVKAKQAVRSPAKKKGSTFKDAEASSQNNTLRFRWKSCVDDENDLKRLEIKEEAVREASRQADKIAGFLRQLITDAEPSGQEAATLDTREMKVWLDTLDDVKNSHEKFRVYIGVAGATGAGKTSALNAILGIRDLLPCSNEAASTAVVCQIAYNDDADPKLPFRAEIVFKKEEVYKDELKVFFEDVRLSQTLDADLEDNDTATRASALQDKREMKENISQSVGKIKAVFGLGEDELVNETEETLLAKNPDVAALLGTVKSFSDADTHSFSNKIKPYLDSTVADHGTSGTYFAAWPLIEEVRVYVKADILKNGVVLVDLPGLGDSDEGRAAVAASYFSKLTFTAIVTRIVRARHEQTGQQLMSDNQELALQMDGKFHKRGFCIVLSQIDEMEPESFMKAHTADIDKDAAFKSSMQQLDHLNEQYKDLEAQISTIRKEERLLAKRFNVAKKDHDAAIKMADDSAIQLASSEMAQAKSAKKSTKNRHQKYKNLLDANRKEAKVLNGHKLFWCLRLRNRTVEKEMQQVLLGRQKRLDLNRGSDNQDENNSIMMFPISSNAYWKVKDDVQKPIGFPREEFTGIPWLRHWLRYSTIPERERHLDTILNRFHILLNNMDVWSCIKTGQPLELTKEFIDETVLTTTLKKLDGALAAFCGKLRKAIIALNPMRSKSAAIDSCRSRCVRVVSAWSLRDPKKSQKVKMAWSTYSACINRRGAPFKSHAKDRPEYRWIESLCNIFLHGIVREWNHALNQQMPELKGPAQEQIDLIWDKFLVQLEKRVKGAAPEMKRHLKQQKPNICAIREEIKDKVNETISNVSAGASQVHRSMNKIVKKKWEKVFLKAKQEKGVGKFQRQEEMIIHHAKLRGQNMFREASEEIENKLRENLKSVSTELKEVRTTAQNRVRDHIMLIIDGASETYDESKADEGMSHKQKTQKAVRKAVSEWAASWRIGEYDDTDVEQLNIAIPEQYDEHQGIGDDDESESGDEYLMDTDSEDDDAMA